MRRRRLAVPVVIVLACACSGSPTGTDGVASTPVSSGPSAPGDLVQPRAPDGDGVGPRAIPAAEVALEVESFPRPAGEACAEPATVVDVPAGGSIAETLENAQPGTLVRLAAGTYVERASESEALRIDTDAICIRAPDGPAVVEAASGQVTGVSVTADDVVIDGLVVRGFEVGISIDGRAGETQRRVTIERSRIEATVGDFRDGITVSSEPAGDESVLDGLLVLDVTVDGVDLGISCNVGPCEHIWVERTTVAGRRSSPGSGADGVAIEEGRQIVVVETSVGGVAADGIDTKADDVVVLGCRIIDVGRNGVKLWRGGDVVNTIIDGTGADASLVGEEPGRYRYLHVLVAHHGDPGETPYVGTWGYDLNPSGMRIDIVNSIFFENSPGGLYVPAGSDLAVRNTIFAGAADDRLVAVGDDEEYAFGELAAFEQAGYGDDNLVADPMFVDPDSRDFATQPGSPARDAGVDTAGLDVDAVGGPRRRGRAPDIGPIES